VGEKLRPKVLATAVNKWAWFTAPVTFFLAIFFIYSALFTEVSRRGALRNWPLVRE
jgi:hypothetical protein